MKRLHIHIATDDLAASIKFYSAMLGAPPTKVKGDYAKWALDEPSVNLSVSTLKNCCGDKGLQHLGIETTDEDELENHIDNLRAAVPDLGNAQAETCCYAKSTKTWTTDPSGVSWENFYSFDDSDIH